MDVKVDVSNVLPGSHSSTSRAAAWLRDELNIPMHETVFEQFEEYFNCRIVVEDRHDSWMQPDKIVFENNQDLVAFLLKWS